MIIESLKFCIHGFLPIGIIESLFTEKGSVGLRDTVSGCLRTLNNLGLYIPALLHVTMEWVKGIGLEVGVGYKCG